MGSAAVEAAEVAAARAEAQAAAKERPQLRRAMDQTIQGVVVQ